jgi:hypothetical protein
VAGRVLAFSDPEVIRLARTYFVPVAGDDWYQRRRQDAEGEFFRKVSDQAGRGSHDLNGGSTRQGIYCLTAAGKLLSFKNAGQLPAVTRNSLREALQNWKKLPEADRQPGAVQIPDADIDPRFTQVPPPGGLILNVYTRLLDHDENGGLCAHKHKTNGALREAQRDHVWLTESEWKALIPAQAVPGDKVSVPDTVRERLFRFHLVDSTAGEPFAWSREQIRAGSLTAVVEESSQARLKVRVEGTALLAEQMQSVKTGRGLEVQLLGYLTYDVRNKSVERFNLVAYGECWGKQAICDARDPQGRRLLGVAFELARGDTAADRVPPQAARWLAGYLQPSK